jgi:hypothetical protein
MFNECSIEVPYLSPESSLASTGLNPDVSSSAAHPSPSDEWGGGVWAWGAQGCGCVGLGGCGQWWPRSLNIPYMFTECSINVPYLSPESSLASTGLNPDVSSSAAPTPPSDEWGGGYGLGGLGGAGVWG